MVPAPARKRTLRLVARAPGTIDADTVAFEVMEFIDQQYPMFWDAHPKTARVNVRNTIIRAVMAEDRKRQS
jgi:hypothetical protein